MQGNQVLLDLGITDQESGLADNQTACPLVLHYLKFFEFCFFFCLPVIICLFMPRYHALQSSDSSFDDRVAAGTRECLWGPRTVLTVKEGLGNE